MDSLWAYIGSALGAIGGLYAAWKSIRKVEVEADSIQVATSDKLLTMVMGQLAYMEAQIKVLQGTLDEYKLQIERYSKTTHSLRERIRILVNYITHNKLPLPVEFDPNY